MSTIIIMKVVNTVTTSKVTTFAYVPVNTKCSCGIELKITCYCLCHNAVSVLCDLIGEYPLPQVLAQRINLPPAKSVFQLFIKSFCNHSCVNISFQLCSLKLLNVLP